MELKVQIPDDVLERLIKYAELCRTSWHSILIFALVFYLELVDGGGDDGEEGTG